MELFKRMAILGAVAVLMSCSKQGDWRGATRASAGIAPDPQTTEEAVVHVYGADAWGWRGWFAIHTWIATKRADEDYYTVYDVVGWRARFGGEVVRISRDIPDRHWFGSRPRLIKAHQGPEAEALIDAVDRAARAYPWSSTYKVFPGPNSNTFTAWIGRRVPDLDLDLPFRAIGAGYADRGEG